MSAHRVVPHKSTGVSPFSILYERHTFIPEEIDHITYAFETDYETAVAVHIAKVLNLQEAVSKNNKEKFSFLDYLNMLM